MVSTKKISIIIPAFNEARNIPELLNRISNVSITNKLDIEVVFVDDGSTDNTENVITDFTDKKIQILYVKFRKNQGKSEALSEGIKRANNELVITMDADLQDQPEEIPKFIAMINSGYDVVSGWKKIRYDNLLFKNIPSYIFNFITRKILKSKLRDINCGFKAYRKEVWVEISVYGDFHRFIPALAANEGFKVGELEVIHAPRIYGKSKYGLGRLISGMFDLLTLFFLSFYQKRPLHFFGSLGIGFISISLIGFVYLGNLWISGISIGNRPMLAISILILSIGFQIIMLGLVSQLLLELFNQANRRRPACKVKKFD